MAKPRKTVDLQIVNGKEVERQLRRLTVDRANRFEKYLNKTDSSSKSFKRCKKFIKTYWQSEIYNTFNARKKLSRPVTGNLGRSLIVKKNGNEIKFVMKPLVHSTNVLGGGQAKDYGRMLRNDTGSTNAPQDAEFEGTKWRYDVQRDKKVRDPRGQAALSPMYWTKWMKKFNPVVKKYTKRYLNEMYEEFVKGGAK